MSDKITIRVLEACESQFNTYVVDHENKNNSEGLRKAAINRGLATMCKLEIARLRQSPLAGMPYTNFDK